MFLAHYFISELYLLQNCVALKPVSVLEHLNTKWLDFFIYRKSLLNAELFLMIVVLFASV